MMASRVAILAGLMLSASGWLSAPMALAAGILIGLILGNPWATHTGRASKILLQAAVVGLGFGLALDEIWRTGRIGLLLTILVISAALAAGFWLGRLLSVPDKTSRLISVGTAICGGSAIAAIAPILRANDDEVGAALATVFTLNAAGLFLFPRLGALLGLGQVEFGYWAALAIHDTSSVVAAGSVYGATALGVATTVKLTRAAWIAPVALAWAALNRSGEKARFPWFIAGFVLAALVRTMFPAQEAAWSFLVSAARYLLVIILFLIGTGMTRKLLSSVGVRPLLHGFLLWLLVATTMLLVIRAIPLPV
ncbi:putative sulfate exporter family transporter [soil metagenome]